MVEHESLSDLESSLTEMDWLAKLNVGGSIAGLGDPVEETTADRHSFSLTSCNGLPNSTNKKTAKPPYSYTHLIMSAISSSPQKRMALSDIYKWIGDNFPYYRSAVTGWKGSYWALSSHKHLSHGHGSQWKRSSLLKRPKAIIQSNEYISDVETANAVNTITDTTPITEEVATSFNMEFKQENFSKNYVHTSNNGSQLVDFSDSFCGLYKSSLDTSLGGDYMLPIDWLKEGVKLTSTLADDVDIDFLLEGIKADKLNPDNIADLAVSLNRFLSQTNGCKNGHLTKVTSDLGSELCLMRNITEKNPMISSSVDQCYSSGQCAPHAVNYVDSSTQYLTLFNGYHHTEEVLCDSQIPVSIGNPLYPQQTIPVGVQKTKPCSQVTDDTDDDDFNWDRLL